MTALSKIHRGRSRLRPFRGSLRLQLLWLWVLIDVLYFSWESATYRGLFAMLCEWQFDRLGQDLPTFNFCVLTMLFGWPSLLILRHRHLRAMKTRETHPDRLDEAYALRLREARERRREGMIAMLAARDYTHYLFGFTAALWLAAASAYLWTWALPNSMADPRVYTPSSLQQQQPVEGAAAFKGTLRYGRISSFSRGILFARRTALYAPLFPPKGVQREIRYFVEFLPAERPDIHSGGLITHREGVLVRSDLPGALMRLYRYLGYHPARHYFVLYVNLDTMRWPYYVFALQFLIGGAIFLIAGLAQVWHSKKLHKRIREVSAQHHIAVSEATLA